MLVCQSMRQLHEKYGNNAAEILMSNCRIWIYMNSRDIGFLERLSTIMGESKSKYTGEKEKLVGISELQHLDDGEVIVLNDRCYPMRGYLKDYSEYCHFYKPVTSESCPDDSELLVPAIYSVDLLESWRKRNIEESERELEYDEDDDDGDISEYMKEMQAIIEQYDPVIMEDIERRKEEDEDIPF